MLQPCLLGALTDFRDSPRNARNMSCTTVWYGYGAGCRIDALNAEAEALGSAAIESQMTSPSRSRPVVWGDEYYQVGKHSPVRHPIA